MKIGWLLTYMGPGGGVRSVLETTNALVRRGHEVYVINPGACRSNFVPQHAKSINMGPDWKPRDTIKEKFDVLINQDPATAGWSATIDARLKILHTCSGFGGAYREFEGKKGVLYDVVTACNHRLEKEHSAFYIGQGVDQRMFAPGKQLPADRAPEIMFCARGGLKQWNAKGAETIARALPDITVKVPWTGWDTDQHPELRDHGMQQVITNPIIHANFGQFYNHYSVAIAPDYVSAWNCVAGEAMACGLALICSDQGTEDFVVDGKNGLVFPAGDAKALAKLVNLVCTDSGVRSHLGYYAQQTFRDPQWSWDAVAERLDKVIQENMK